MQPFYGIEQSGNTSYLVMELVAGETLGYMAPEQARGKRVAKRADIWAFGVVLYEMVTGKRSFDGEDVAHTLAAVTAKPANDSVTTYGWKALAGSVIRYSMDGFDLLILSFMLSAISTDLGLTAAKAGCPAHAG